MTNTSKPAVVESNSHRESPRVSVIVIAYNEQERIGDCVASITAQSFEDIEIVIVDDGSTDSTVDRLQAAFSDETRLRILELGQNRGRGAARLAGLEAARGDLIAFVDADIVLQGAWLQSLLDNLPGHSAVSGIAVPDGDCAVIWRMFRPTARIHAGSEQITGNNVLFVGDVIREIGFDATSKLGEDFRLASRMRGLGHRLATVSEVTVEHREAKTYRKAFRWLFDSGVDATSLFVEFGRVRLPDVTWLAWLLGQCALVTLLAMTPISLFVVGAISGILTASVAFGHVYSRFDPRLHPIRWLLAAFANVPLMGAYLVGRTVGAVRILLRSLRK